LGKSQQLRIAAYLELLGCGKPTDLYICMQTMEQRCDRQQPLAQPNRQKLVLRSLNSRLSLQVCSSRVSNSELSGCGNESASYMHIHVYTYLYIEILCPPACGKPPHQMKQPNSRRQNHSSPMYCVLSLSRTRSCKAWILEDSAHRIYCHRPRLLSCMLE